LLLDSDVTSTGACFTIDADNVVLDCAGFKVDYGSDGTSNQRGITANSRLNITIRNCRIQDINSGGSVGYGILLSLTNDSLIVNNTIQTNGTGFNYALNIDTSTNNTVINNTIKAEGAGTSIGINLNVAIRTNVTQNTISTNGTGASDGISFSAAVNNTVINNTITTQGTGTNNNGLDVDGRGNIISENTIQTNGTSLNDGIDLVQSTSNNTIITNNNITTQGTSSGNNGIKISTNSGTTISGNTITTNGTTQNQGIEMQSFSVNNTITNNTITTAGSTGGTIGITLSQSSTNTVSQNTILVNGTSGSNGIRLTTSANNNTISNNNIRTYGTSDQNHGINVFTTSSNNTISENIIRANGTSSNFGINVQNFANNNTFFNNNITTAGTDSYGISIMAANNTIFNGTIFNNPVQWLKSTTSTNINNNFTNTTFVTENGSIQIFGTFNLTGMQDITRFKINITQNNAFLNSTNMTFMNLSATITLQNITLIEALVEVDFDDDGIFEDCDEPDCFNLSYDDVNDVFVFNVSSFTTYQAAEGAIIVCENISVADNYQLAADISSSGTCLNITGDDIVLDCQGFNITYDIDGLGNNHGILVNNSNNVTIRDCNIRDNNSAGINGFGIAFQNVNNSLIFNNTIQTNGTATNYGVYILGAQENNTIRQNIITAQGTTSANTGILFNSQTGLAQKRLEIIGNDITAIGSTANARGLALNPFIVNSTIANNTINASGLTAAGQAAVGIEFSGEESLIEGNNITTNGTSNNWGMRVNSGNDVRIRNNIISTNGTDTRNVGILIQTANGTNITGNTITTNGTDKSFGIWIFSFSNNTMVINNTITTSGTKAYAITIEDSSNGTLINNTLDNPAEWLATGDETYTFINTTRFKTENGSITQLEQTAINGSHNLTHQNLNLSQNNAFLNSTNLTFLNFTSEISLNDILFENPKVQKDDNDTGVFADCNEPDCFNLSFIDAFDVFLFNVSSFTTYQAADGVILCRNLTSSANLTEDVFAEETCFNITSDNVVLDCKGFTISYGNGGVSGFGVDATGRENITIKECNIRDTNSGGGNGYGVLLSGTNSSVVINNSIQTNGSVTNFGVRITDNAHNNTIANNTIKTQGTVSNVGIDLFDRVSGNNISENIIQTNGTSSNRGVSLTTTSDNNTITNNTITTGGTGNLNQGIRLSTSSGNNISGNTIQTNGTSSNEGIRIGPGSNNTITR